MLLSAVSKRPFARGGRLPCQRPSQHRAAATAKVVNGVRHERGRYATVTAADVGRFRSLLGEPNVLVGARDVEPYNVDYMRHVSGKKKKPSVSRFQNAPPPPALAPL